MRTQMPGRVGGVTLLAMLKGDHVNLLFRRKRKGNTRQNAVVSVITNTLRMLEIFIKTLARFSNGVCFEMEPPGERGTEI